MTIALCVGGAVVYLYILPQISLQTYDQNDIYFKYPEDWQIWEGPPDLAKHMAVADLLIVKSNRLSTNLGVKRDQMEGNKLNIEESLVILEKQLQEYMSDFEKIAYQNIIVSGEKAIDYTFKYSLKEATGAGGIAKWYGQQRQVIFFKNGTLYTLIFTAEPSDFDKDNKDFSHLLKTFRAK